MSFCLFWAGLAVLVGVASAEGLTADAATRSALTHDPRHVAAIAAVEAARGEARAATALRENPTLSAELAVGQPRWSAGLMQPISLTGEGLARRDAATAALDAAELELRRSAVQVSAEARAAWVDVWVAEAQLGLSAEAHAQSRARRVAVEARVAAGDAAGLDARLARLVEADAAARRLEAQAAVGAARVKLARFVPDAGGLRLAGGLADAAPVARGGGVRTDVEAAARRLAAAEAELRAERAASVPMVGIGATVEREGDLTLVGPALELTLPIWKANPAGRAAARAALAEARAEADAVARSAEAEQATARATATLADDLHGDAPDATAEARAALADIDRAEGAGELDAAVATLLRQEVLDGALGALDLARAAVLARLDALLATSDPALLPLDVSEVSP